MSRQCPSCGTMFPDFAQVCAQDGIALVGIPRLPRLTTGLGVLALAAFLWAGVGLGERWLRSQVRVDIVSVERSGKTIVVTGHLTNNSRFPVDIGQSQLSEPTSLGPGGTEKFTLRAAYSDTVQIDWDADFSVHAAGLSWSSRASQEILLRIRN